MTITPERRAALRRLNKISYNELLDALEAALEDLGWIACASRDEIEDMLMYSVFGDVDDMRRFIREARLAEGKK